MLVPGCKSKLQAEAAQEVWAGFVIGSRVVLWSKNVYFKVRED